MDGCLWSYYTPDAIIQMWGFLLNRPVGYPDMDSGEGSAQIWAGLLNLRRPILTASFLGFAR